MKKFLHQANPRIIILAFFISAISFNQAKASDYYWVNGTGNWSDFLAHWATTSGGAVFHVSAPTAADDVYFDANSFALPGGVVTIDMEAFCKNMNWTGVTNNPDLGGASNLNIYGSLTYVPGMTLSYTSQLMFKSAAAGNTVDFANLTLPNWGTQFDGAGEWTLLSDVITLPGMGSITLSQGTLNTNNKTLTIGWLQSWPGFGTRTLNLGSSIINCQSINLWDPTSLTFDAGTSVITITDTWFMGNGLTYYDFNFNPTMAGNVSIQGSNKFHNLSFTNPLINGVSFEAGSTQTIFDMSLGASCTMIKSVMSNNAGQTATIKKLTGTLNEDFLAIQDITVIGGATFTTNNGVNLGNVVNWTINAGSSGSFYWVGGTGNWSDPAHWSNVSGGAYPSANICLPSTTDDVYFDANSFTAPGQTITIDVPAICKNMNWSGVTNIPTLSAGWGKDFYIFGSLTFAPGIMNNVNGNFVFYAATAGNTITSAGFTFQSEIRFEGAGEWILQDDLTSSANISHNCGTVSTNDKKLTINSYFSNTTKNRQFFLGSSELTLAGTYNLSNPANMTVNSVASLIKLSGSYFDGGGFIYNDLTLFNTFNTYINNSNTFNIITNSNAGDVIFQSGTTTTISDLTSTGSCADMVSLRSGTPGVQAILSKASGAITINYASIKDMNASGGATFNANNSIDAGGNSGWTFTPLASTDYYWVGGSGNWSDPLHWSLSSGGPANPSSCIPSSVDNVFFDGLSGLGGQTVSVNQEAFCKSMDWTGANNAIFNIQNPVNIYGSLTFIGAMTVNGTSNILFKSDNAGNTINTVGKILSNNIYFDGNGTWTLQNNFSLNTGSFYYIFFNKGTLNTNNFTLTAREFYSSTSFTRTLNLGSSVLNFFSWSITNGSNFSINPGTSQLNVTQSTNFQGGSANYFDVNISLGSDISLYGNNSYNILNIPNCNSLILDQGSTHTFVTLTIPGGTNCLDLFSLKSNVSGAPANLIMAAGVFTGNWLEITDVTAGGGGTFNAFSSQGIGTTTGWNIAGPAGVNLYWIGGTGNWSDPNHWSLTSGGGPYTCVPTINDSVFFDLNSFSAPGQTVDISTPSYCKNMKWTGVTNNPTLSGWALLTINGSLTFVPGMTLTYWSNILLSSPTAGNTITSAGLLLSGIMIAGTGDYSLTDDLNLQWNGLTLNSGTFSTNNKNIISTGDFNSSTASNRVLNLGTSTLSFQNWAITDNTNFTLNAGTSQISTNNNSWNFNGGNLTYYNVHIAKPSWSSPTIMGSNTFNILSVEAGTDLLFEAGTTQTTTDFQATGNPGEHTQLHSTLPGNIANIAQPSNPFCGDYLTIQDISVAGNTFYAGNNSINNGNNSGWTWSGVTANYQYPAAMCEDVAGGGTVAGINLTLLQNAIDGGGGFGHTWYSDAALTTLVPDATNVTVSNEQVFYDIVNNGTCSNVAEVAYSVYTKPVLSVTQVNNTCFGGSAGSVDLTVSSGLAPYTYSWTGGQTTQDVAGLTAGNHTVTVTDANTCASNLTTAISQPAVLAATVTPVNVTVCIGNNNGSITMSAASGGSGSYEYTINGGTAWQASASFANLTAGSYDVRIRDAADPACVITLNAALVLTEPTVLSATLAKTDATCNGTSDGTITINGAAGGGGTYEYTINGGTAWQASNSFTGLATGSYDVRIRDAANPTCTVTLDAAYSISQPAVLAATVTPVNVTVCNGNNNGSITMSAASGGSGSYEYTVNGGTAWQASASFANLTAGTYDVKIRDAAATSCVITLNAALVLTEPVVLSATLAKTDATCNGTSDGTITVNGAAGGGGTYQYSINGGGAWQASNSFAGLAAGSFDVRIRDAANPTCTVTLDAAYSISQPAVLAATVTPVNVTVCNGNNNGSITMSAASGGSGSYEYTVNGGTAWQASASFANLIAGTYDVKIRDAAATTCVITLNAALVLTEPAVLSATLAKTDITCNGASDGTITVNGAAGGNGTYEYTINGGTAWQASNSFTGLATSSYDVRIRDAANPTCTVTLDAVYSISQPAVLAATVTPVNVTVCNGNNNGSITMSAASGGSGSYEYTVNGGTAWQASASFSNLIAGTYDVKIRDAAATSCVITLDAALILTEPVILSATASKTGITCNGASDGTITVNGAAGGSGTYQYSINGGAAWQVSNTFSGLSASFYNVQIRDGSNPSCSVIINDSLMITEPAAVVVTANTTALAICAGDSITLTGSGASTYSWSDGVTDGAAFAPVSTTTYTVTGTDVNGCSDTDQITITVNPLPTANITGGNICIGNAVTLVVSGGISYSWSTGSSNDSITVSPGTTTAYIATATDANGCTDAANYTVTVFTLPVANAGSDTTICNGQAVFIMATGGPNYLWSNGINTDTMTVAPVVTTNYTVTVTDANNCSNSDVVTVFVNNLPTASISGNNTLCIGDTTTLTASGGVSYAWSSGDSVAVIVTSPATSTNYTVTITDANGCSDTEVFAVTVNALPTVSANATATLVCEGTSVTLTGSGASSYAWDNGITDGVPFNANAAMTYTVTGTDANGCVNTDQITIALNYYPIVSVTSVTNPSSCGTSDGTISVTDDITYTYSWSTNPAQTTSTASNLTAGNYVVTISSGLCSTTRSQSISDPTAPVVTILSDDTDNTVCNGGSITFTADGLASGAYIFYVDGSPADTAVYPANTFVLNGISSNHNVSAVGTEGSCTGASSAITVDAFSDPVLTTNGNASICYNSFHGIALSLTGPQPWTIIFNYVGVFDTIHNLNAATYTYQVSPAIQTDYNITAIDANGCVATDAVTISVNPVYSVNATASICQGDSILLGGSWQYAGGSYTDTYQTVNGCDSVIVTDLTVNPVYNANATASICQGDSLFLGGSWQTAGGSYTDTYQTVNGCDSVIVTDLTVNPVYNETASASICQGDSMLLGGSWQYAGGSYTDLYTSVNGCDSAVVTTLTVNPAYSANQSFTICQGDSLFAGGNWQFTAGSYTDVFQTTNGCDSTVVTDLTVNPSYLLNQSATICSGDSAFLGGSWQQAAGNYTDAYQSVNGCDSIIVTGLIVNPVYQITLNTQICQGDSLLAGGSWQYAAGSYTDSYQTVNGCDSIVTTNLVVTDTINVIQDIGICFGDSIFVGGSWQYAGGTFVDSLTAIFGCDSIVITNLTVYPVFNETASASVCQGDSILLGGSWQTAGGSYTDVYPSVNGCDSTVVTTLTVNPAYSANQSFTICQGDSMFLGSNWQYAGGSYTDVYQTTYGCDSIIITDLTVNPAYHTTITVSICSGDSIFLGGSWQYASGSYTDSYQTLNGCDSIIVTDLTVNPVYNANATASICQGDSIFLGGNWQYAGGSYTDSYQTANGCDSIIVTDLTVNPVYNANATASICQGDSLFIGGSWQYAGGSYTDSYLTVNGCDSIIVTDLTVNPVYQITVSSQICQGDSLFAGGNWQYAGGSYTDSYQTVNGCDSIVTTNLVVTDTIHIVQDAAICSGDSIFAGGSWQLAGGTFIDSFTAAFGCDSVVTTNVTVNPVYNETASATICQGDSLFLGGSWQYAGGSYTDVYPSFYGCDSTVVTTLTVNPAYSANQSFTICQGDSMFLGGSWQYAGGSYTDVYPTVNGCDSTVITNLTVNALPLVNLGPDDSLCFETNDTLLLDAGNAGATYLWSDNSTSQIFATNATTLGIGLHAVWVSVDNGTCVETDTIQVFVDVCNAIAVSGIQTFVSMYPNPTDGILNISVNNKINRLTVSIISPIGQEIFNQTVEGNSTGFDFRNYPSGVYFVKVQTGKAIRTEKIVVK